MLPTLVSATKVNTVILDLIVVLEFLLAAINFTKPTGFIFLWFI